MKAKHTRLLENLYEDRFSWSRLFFEWMNTPKPNPKRASWREELVFGFKVISGTIYFALGMAQQRLVSWITKYYPFSLLWRDKLYHAKNLPVRDLMNRLEVLSRKIGAPIMLTGGEEKNDYSEIEGYFEGRVHNRSAAIKKLERGLQAKFSSLYVRRTDMGIKIIVPTEVYEDC